MKKRSRILSFMLACIFAIGCTSFAVTSVLAEEETTLFYESFDLATYSSTTEYNGKAGAWTVTGTNAAHDAANGTIYISNSSTSAQWQFDFTEQYEGAMKLKVTAEILTGYTGADSMMSIHLMSNDHNNVLGLCTFDGGNIYANALDSNSATAAYNTGASYDAQHLYTVTGIIDQENESFLLSVYDNTADSAVLTDFNVPYKHKKENYAKMTSGFQTVRVNAKRVKNQKGYELKDFSVKQIISDPPVSDYLFNEGFESSGYASTTVYNGKAGAWTLTGSGHGYDIDTSIYVQNGNNNATWQFDFTEQYEGAMKLEAVAEIEAGSTESGLRMRIDLMSDAGVLGLCTFEGGTIYANVLDANAATAEYNTGASYVSGHIYTVTGIIDEAKESFLLSVHDDTADSAVLNGFSVPYKHKKSDYAKMTSGFKTVRINAVRVTGKKGYELNGISVKRLPSSWTVQESDITLTGINGDIQDWNSVSPKLASVAIDFGTEIEASTATTSNIYIEKASTHEIVSATGNLSGNVYTLTVSGSLSANTAYNIVIKADVETASGITNDEDVIFSFTTSGEILFNEGFESSDYASTTVYNGKAGAWTLTGSGHGYDSDTSIYVQNGNNNATWQFDFTEQYEGAMKLKAIAEIEAGSTESGLRMRIDLMSDAGVLGLCTFEGGTIYANVLDANAATAEYNTGASYVSGHIYTVTGIIDEAKESFLLSVHDDTADSTVLNGFSVPYKHKKTDYAKMTSGFKTVRINAVRVSGKKGYELNGISVQRLPLSWTVTESNITLTDASGITQPFVGAAVLTNQISIDFGAAMNESSLNENSVYLEKDSDGSRLPYLSSYSGNIYTMTLSSSLEAGEQYNIVIDTTVKTAENIGNDSNTVISFTTAGAGTLSPDYSYDRNFAFDSLDGWTKAGKTDTMVSEGKLTVPTSSTGERIAKYTYDPQYENVINLEVTYDIIPGADTSSRVQLGGSAGYIVLANFNGGTVYANTYSTENSMGITYTPGQLYKVRCVIDQVNTTLHVWVYDASDNVLVNDYTSAPFGGNNGRGASIEGLSYVQVTNNVAAEGGDAVQIDNLTVTELLPAPTVSASSISIGVLGGETFDNFANIDPIANEIILDFGTVLNTSTLTAGSVQVLKNGTPLNTTLSYGNRRVTLVINDVLLANTTYTISVAGTIANNSGVAIGDSIEIDFTTGAASKSATIGRIAIDDVTVTSLAQILTGDNMVVEVDYKNSTRENQMLNLIVATYNGKDLIDVDYTSRLIDASVTKSTFKFTSTDVVKGNDIDEIKVMIWDGFDETHMHPLSPCVTFRQ